MPYEEMVFMIRTIFPFLIKVRPSLRDSAFSLRFPVENFRMVEFSTGKESKPKIYLDIQELTRLLRSNGLRFANLLISSVCSTLLFSNNAFGQCKITNKNPKLIKVGIFILVSSLQPMKEFLTFFIMQS